MEFAGRRITIIGLAREGTALAQYLSGEGALVTVSDSKTAEQLTPFLEQIAGLPVRLSLGGNREEDILSAHIIFVSPAVPRELSFLRAATQAGIPITSETELFFERCPAPIIGITGSSGKTTTTTLIGEMLRADGRHPVFVGGNIGRPLINNLKQMAPDSWVVLELSSFQLEYLRRSPHVAVVTNVTPNHLDRHGTMEVYSTAKRQIVAHQKSGDYVVLNAADTISAGMASATPAQPVFFSNRVAVERGAMLEGDSLVLRGMVKTGPFSKDQLEVCRQGDLKIRGAHNVDNCLSAIAATSLLGIPIPIMRQVLTTFTGVEHRLQLVAEKESVRYYNDSIATAPERTLAALEVFTEPVLLIAGGRDKHLPWEKLASEIVRKVRILFLIGEAADLIATAVEQARAHHGNQLRGLEQICKCVCLERAVHAARVQAKAGEVVLLSPACTSYDQYADFEERGQHFVSIVQAEYSAGEE